MNGTSDFYPRKRNFEFAPRDAFNNTWMMRRDRYFQFNNRDSYGRYPVWQQPPRWHEFRRVPKTWQSWFQYRRAAQDARPKAAPSSYGAVNPHQPFIPRPPFNLRVTIPNFSGVHPPDLFLFRNSSAKFTSAPTSQIPPSSSCFESNNDVRSNKDALQSKETEVNDDVQYLYTVQTKGDEIVEVVDLSEGSEVPSCTDKTRASHYFLRSNSIASSYEKEGGIDKTIGKMPEKEMEPSSKKQYAAPRKGRKRKKSPEDLHCDICENDYEFVKNKGEDIFKSRCGHMFCQQCLKKLDPYKCPECNLYLQKLFKVFL